MRNILLLCLITTFFALPSNGFIYNFFLQGKPMEVTAGNAFGAEDGVLWSDTITAEHGSGVYSWTLTTFPAGATINSSTGLVSYTAATAGTYNFTARVTDVNAGTVIDHDFYLNVYDDSTVCTWTGAEDTDWANANNWDLCGGSAPGASSAVAIPSNAANQPRISSSTTIDSFGQGVDGGTVTLASATLTLANTTTSIRSDVQFQGSYNTCTNCHVLGTGTFYIVDGATVTLLKGIRMGSGGNNSLYIGNGTTAGHLKTSAGATLSEWPVLPFAGGYKSVVVNGTSTERSTVDFDGVFFTNYSTNGGNALLTLVDWYEIIKLDNARFDTSPSADYIRFNDCTNALVSDTAWNSISFERLRSIGVNNVDAAGTNCSTLPTISVTTPSGENGGDAFGESFENDPNNKIDWPNGGSFICTWTGAVDTSWANPSNWNNCTNGRSNYPDQLDSVIIPVTANQPVVSATTGVKSFEISGSGGGTVTINSGVSLQINNSAASFRSDVQFQGSSTTCTNCWVSGQGSLAIVDSATVTLIKGIRLTPGGNNSLNVGNGSSAGHLKTTGGTTESEWPGLLVTGGYKSVVVNGTSSERSTVDFDGANFYNYGTNSGTALLTLGDWYEIVKMDNAKFDSNTSSNDFIRFNDCTNALVSDTTWSSIKFLRLRSVGTNNIDAAGTSCSSLPTISVTTPTGENGGASFGEVFENDPNNKINWPNGSTFTCTWTGATDTSWTNSGNWSGCTNGRGNYPDQLDYAIIPVTGNQPVISATTGLRGFALSGSGGGTVTINTGVSLQLNDSAGSFRSDIFFQGSTTTCTNCYVSGQGALAIVDSATVTLIKGIRLANGGNSSINVGNGTTAGHLKTTAGSTSSEWPALTVTGGYKSVVLNGTSTERSTIDLDGANFANYGTNGGNAMLHLLDWYQIVKMDNTRFDTSTTGNDFMRFVDCTNALISDTTWTGMRFEKARAASAQSVDAAGTSCSTLPTININGATGASSCGAVGTGACVFENDPNSKINWN